MTRSDWIATGVLFFLGMCALGVLGIRCEQGYRKAVVVRPLVDIPAEAFSCSLQDCSEVPVFGIVDYRSSQRMYVCEDHAVEVVSPAEKEIIGS